MSEFERNVRNTMRSCRHYTGLAMNKTCAAGVAYDSVKAKGEKHIMFPCLLDYATVNGKELECVSRSLYSRDEAEERERHHAAVVKAFLEKMESDICHVCDIPITQYEQIGRCVYAKPCNHRQYQGTIPKEKRGVLQ